MTDTTPRRTAPNLKAVGVSGVVRVPLVSGGFAMISETDAELVMQHQWRQIQRARGHYAATVINGKQVFMHRLILGAKHGQVVNRKTNDPLDNRRDNLFIAKSAGTMKPDSKLRSHNKSGFNGVCRSRGRNGWVAQITYSGRTVCLGRFDDPEDAAHAFDNKAWELRGPMARLNFPTVRLPA